jgi:radical SAM-linked protein
MTTASYRLWFSKRGRERFLSHLDLARLFGRAIRRAALPVRFSEGFTPRPSVSFPLALGIGIESEDEIAEVVLLEELEPDGVRERFNGQLPEGVRILRVERLEPGDRAIVESVEVEVIEPPAPADWAERAAGLMARAEVWVERDRGGEPRRVDIRPYLQEFRCEEGRLIMVLKVTPQGTARPSEPLQALGFDDPAGARMLKKKTNLRKARA